MISLKLQHNHHLPCHPTRHFLENQASINETDREQISQQQSQDDNPQYKAIGSRMLRPQNLDSQFEQQQRSSSNNEPAVRHKKKKRNSKNNKNKQITPQQIYNTSLLDKSFTASTTNLPINIRMLIMQQQKLVEDKVYIGITSHTANANTILQRIYQEDANMNNVQINIKQGLYDLMKDLHKGITHEILNTQQYHIHKIIRSSKNDVLTNRRGRLNLNYSTNSSFPNNQGASQSDNLTTNSQPVTKGDYSLASQQTKKAEDFIKNIQRQQQKLRQNHKQQEVRKKSLEVRSVQEKREFQQQIKQERRNYLKRRFEAKKQIREKELATRDKMNQQYKQFLVKYKKKTPLFQKKEKQYAVNQSIEEKKFKEYISEKRKQQLRPFSIDQLKQHQRQYRSLKIEKETQKKSEKKLKLEEINKTRPHHTYHKSKYFDIIQQQQEQQKQRQIKEDPKLLRSDLMKKRDIYAKSVRQNYLPKSSIIKHKQLQDQIQKMKWAEQLTSKKKSDRQYIDEGDKNLKDLHRQIAQLREQGKIPQNYQTLEQSSLGSPRTAYKNYLQQIRNNNIKARNNSSRSHKRYASIDFIDKNQKLDVYNLQQLAKDKQLKANRRYLYANSSHDVGKNLKEMGEADDIYIQSVKAKVALLNKLQ